MQLQHSNRGLTRIELLIVTCCLSLVLAICSVVLGGDGHGARTQARVTDDAKRLRAIHQAMVVFAREFDGSLPRPGLVDRLPDPDTGREVPGRGPEDHGANTTANLYSMLIVNNYMTSRSVVSELDRNPNVSEKEDYNYERYSPADDAYWDDTFSADLKQGSNASYAHLVIHGERAAKYWRDVQKPLFVVLGNRGPLEGEPDADSYTCGPLGHWAGIVVFNDNHTEVLRTFHPTLQKPRGLDGNLQKDNIFKMEDGSDGADAILSFTRSIGEAGPELQHD